jgi:hypothetical protein
MKDATACDLVSVNQVSFASGMTIGEHPCRGPAPRCCLSIWRFRNSSDHSDAALPCWPDRCADDVAGNYQFHATVHLAARCTSVVGHGVFFAEALGRDIIRANPLLR